MRYLPDLRISKNADVKFSCLLRFGIEPQEGLDLFRTTQFNRRLSQSSTLNSEKERGFAKLYAFSYPPLAYYRSTQQICRPNSKNGVSA